MEHSFLPQQQLFPPFPITSHWRFEDLQIWQEGAELAVRFHRVAQRLNRLGCHRYAEQLRAAGLSVPNNIAEGSASPHWKEFVRFLSIARSSLFENSSMILVFQKMDLLEQSEVDELMRRQDLLSRKISVFIRSRKAKDAASKSS